jgi:hypothetical protein
MTKREFICKFDPCDEGKDWLKGKTLKKAWETCDHPDWMYWALSKLGYDDAATYRKLACSHALSVAHLWDMPAIVRQYLETQDERILAAAWAAERDAAGPAARDAAWAAARAAERDAQCDTIRSAIPWAVAVKLIREARE